MAHKSIVLDWRVGTNKVFSIFTDLFTLSSSITERNSCDVYIRISISSN